MLLTTLPVGIPKKSGYETTTDSSTGRKCLTPRQIDKHNADRIAIAYTELSYRAYIAKLEDVFRPPSVEVDAFAKSTVCYDLDL